MAFDKELLFRSRLPEADVEVEGLGTVRVRALSRADVLTIQRHQDDDTPGAFERKMLALALVDPELTEDEVGHWQRACLPGELEPVTDKVSELSGLSDGAAKEAYLEFEENPDAEFRVLPGGEVGHDGGAAAG